MTAYGYARVSTDDQDLASQLYQLEAAGLEPRAIHTDTVTGIGGMDQRPGWRLLMCMVAIGDTITVTRLDRVTRSLETMLQIRRQLGRAGVRLVSLSDPSDDGTASGDFVSAVLAASAELERRVLRDRQAAGIAAARDRGQRLGRPAALSPAQARQARAMADAGDSVSTISHTFGVSRATVRAAIERQAPYATASASA